jgi:hypothetical protein
VKLLGEASEDVDDAAAWIQKSRALEEKAKREAREKALKQARALEEQVQRFCPALFCFPPLALIVKWQRENQT